MERQNEKDILIQSEIAEQCVKIMNDTLKEWETFREVLSHLALAMNSMNTRLDLLYELLKKGEK